MLARYYDPSLGRFISKDPFDGVKNDPQTLNGYVYVGNNPVNRTDPSGKCEWCANVLAALSGGRAEQGYDVTFHYEVTGAAGVFLDVVDREAFTLGHHVFTAGETLDAEIMAHELGHVPQYELEGGMFLPKYAYEQLGVVVGLSEENRFEREADEFAADILDYDYWEYGE